MKSVTLLWSTVLCARCVCSQSWRVVLRASCDLLLTEDEVECCSRVVELCCDSPLAVYAASGDRAQFAASSRTDTDVANSRLVGVASMYQQCCSQDQL